MNYYNFNVSVLPVMISTKLLPEIEAEDIVKKEHLLQGMQHLPVHTQIEKLKVSKSSSVTLTLFANSTNVSCFFYLAG